MIDQWLAKEPELLATRVHQDLVRDYGFEGSYNTVRRYVERSRPKSTPRQEERFETRPGHQAQVDWSHEQPIRTSSGLELPLYCFHMVLGHSRDSFCRLTGSQDLVTFWACHRAAFQHFGGVPHELLYDRTKTVVRQHVGKDVTLEQRDIHPEALASAHHYGFSMRLCQAYRAKTKGKVESECPTSGSGCSAATASPATRKRTSRGCPGTRRSPASACTAPTARSSRFAPSVTARRCCRCRRPRPGRRAHHSGGRPRRVFSFEGRRYHVPDPKPGERVELVLGAEEIEVHSTVDGRRLARHERGRPVRILPDPIEKSVPLAQVLSALPDPEVHRRPLDRYQEAIDG